MKLRIFYLAVLLFSFSIISSRLIAQKSYQLFDQHIVKKGADYYVIDTLRKDSFLVYKEVITVKYKTVVDYIKRKEIELFNNLIFIRENELGYVDYKLKPNIDPIQAIQQLVKTNLIDYARPASEVKYLSNVPDDPGYIDQYYLDNLKYSDINILPAWDITTGDSTISVGIIDLGVNINQEDLGFGTDDYENIFTNEGEDKWVDNTNPGLGNGIDDDKNGYIDDYKGIDFDSKNNYSSTTSFSAHGTQVGGIVAAKRNNALGISGIAGGNQKAGCKIISISLPYLNTSFDDAVLYACKMGARVIQTSLAIIESNDNNEALERAYKMYGVLIVAAAGNSESNDVFYPARNTNVIAVGATDKFDNKPSWFTCFGDSLELAAPGVDIYSTSYNQTDGDYAYRTQSGTSFSAPQVSGVAALMFSANKCLTNNEVRELLKSTADQVGGANYSYSSKFPGRSKEFGYGRINAGNAVQAAANYGISYSDLYIKDKIHDMGQEPNPNEELAYWESESIWIRNQDDGLSNRIHQNPIYGKKNYVYVRVDNKGCIGPDGSEKNKIVLG